MNWSDFPTEGQFFAIMLGLEVGIIVICGVALYYAYSNWKTNRAGYKLLNCMIACPFSFGTPEFDAWVRKCAAAPGGRPVIKEEPK